MSVTLLLEQAFQLQNQGQFAQAEKLYSQALKSVRDNPALWFNHGLVLRDLGQTKKALASFDQAQRLSPPMAEIENERGNALRELRRFDDALAALDRALALRPFHPGTLINRGLVRIPLKQLEGALADFDAALRLEPRLPLALVNRGATLEKLKRPGEALAAYRQALAAAPGDPTALFQCGTLLSRQGRYEEALSYYDRALAADPSLGAARLNRARALLELKRFDEGHAEMKRAFAEHPDAPLVLDGLLESTLMTCDFPQRLVLEPELAEHVRAGTLPLPMRMMQYIDDPALQLACATAYVKNLHDISTPTLPSRRASSGRRLKLAYLSYDFRSHAVAICAAALLEKHDRSRFELFAVSTGPDDSSPIRRRVAAAFERFLDVHEQRDDSDVAKLLAQEEIDILIDLGGHTAGARPGIAARRPAPVQVSFLGWAGTTGDSVMDYLIADAVVALPASDSFFTEKLVRLPHCYHPTDPSRDPFAATPTRAQVGLPEGAFVFCAFNGVVKISPPVFRIWMELLREVPGSLLWLRQNNEVAARNLRQQAAALGIAPERLVFAGVAEEAEHLARYRLADLFLDTLPFTGHSTAIESLWAGLPLVSCAGASFASRVSASALHAVGMPELVATSLPEYKALALKLARDPALLASYRERLDKGRMTSPLFDVDGFARALETAYETMAERSRAGLPPEAFACR
jgi:protein O-GlcNAc transferase